MKIIAAALACIAAVTQAAQGGRPLDGGAGLAADAGGERTGMAPVNGIEMYYAVYGEGEPVLLIHGGLGTPTSGARRWPS